MKNKTKGVLNDLQESLAIPRPGPTPPGPGPFMKKMLIMKVCIYLLIVFIVIFMNGVGGYAFARISANHSLCEPVEA